MAELSCDAANLQRPCHPPARGDLCGDSVLGRAGDDLGARWRKAGIAIEVGADKQIYCRDVEIERAATEPASVPGGHNVEAELAS
jgi:hypothetical protein